jgi:hypothetical protein
MSLCACEIVDSVECLKAAAWTVDIAAIPWLTLTDEYSLYYHVFVYSISLFCGYLWTCHVMRVIAWYLLTTHEWWNWVICTAITSAVTVQRSTWAPFLVINFIIFILQLSKMHTSYQHVQVRSSAQASFQPVSQLKALNFLEVTTMRLLHLDIVDNLIVFFCRGTRERYMTTTHIYKITTKIRIIR